MLSGLKNEDEGETFGNLHMSALGIYINPELPPLLSYTSYLSTANTAVQLSPSSTALLLQRHNICLARVASWPLAFRQRHSSGIVVGAAVGICRKLRHFRGIRPEARKTLLTAIAIV